MTARQINKAILDAHSVGRYMYLIQGPTAVRRIIRARTTNGRIEVRCLSSGSWLPVISTDKFSPSLWY